MLNTDKEIVQKVCSGDPSHASCIPDAIELLKICLKDKELYLYASDFNKARKFGQLIGIPFTIIYHAPRYIKDGASVVILGSHQGATNLERYDELMCFLQSRRKLDVWHIVRWH